MTIALVTLRGDNKSTFFTWQMVMVEISVRMHYLIRAFALTFEQYRLYIQQ